MADDADVRYVLRADDSRLEADLSRAENTVRRSAQRAEQNADRVGKSANRSFDQTAAAAQGCGDELENLGDDITDVGDKSEKSADKVENKLGSALGAVGKAAAAASAAVGAAAVAVGTAAVNSADSLDKAVNRVISATGASEDAAEQYAEVIKGVYGDNFGESFDDIAASVSTITQNLGEMDEVTLQNVTERAYTLQDVFDMGVDESARAAKAMRENFGIAAEDAYDYIAKGAQDGLNYSGELLDSISEYSVQFAKLGFSADDMFNIFAQGAENGAWNLDKVGDAIKEFSIRAIDGSDTTRAGFEAIGYDADDMAEKFAQGGDVARDSFKTVVTALSEMEDPIKRDAAGVNLFGTMWEDLGVEAVAALGDISDSAYDCAGAMDGIMEVNYSSLSDALSGLQRQAELLIQPLGETLLPVVKEVIDELSDMADEALPQLVEAIQPVIEKLVPLIAPLMDLISSVLPQLVELVSPVIGMVSELVQTTLPPLTEFLKGELLPVVINMFKWLEENLFPVVQKIISKLLPPLLKIVGSLLPLIETALDLLNPVLGIVEALIEPIAAVLEALSPIVTILTDLVKTILDPIRQQLSDISDGLSDSASILTDVLGKALEIVAELLSDTLMPAFEGLIQFLNGDFMGACETWGEGFENTMRNVFAHIDEIFGTHLAEWYDEFNAFWRDVGAKLYELNHADEINEIELQNKYGGLDNDVILRSNELMRLGSTAEEALSKAISEIVNTDEKAYYWKEHFEDIVTVDEAESRRRQMQANGTLRADYYDEGYSPPPSTIAGSWYEDYYKEIAARGAAQSVSETQPQSQQPQTSLPSYGYKPAANTPASAQSSSRSSSQGSSQGSSRGSSRGSSKGTFISVTSYVPTIWDSDQTAALKSLIGKDVLGNTTSAHQINALTGVTAGESVSASATGETTLADVVNAITKLQRRVEKIEDAVGDATIVLKAGDLTLGKAAVRDINSIAKQSGKSPFNF